MAGEKFTNADNTMGQRLTAPVAGPFTDPSILTTQQLLRELSSLREIIEARLNGNDKAIDLLQAATDKQPEVMAKAVKQLRELHQEKFDSIQTQFRERDVRTEQAQIGSKTAVDTAFVAQKEAVGAALQAAKEAVSEQNKSNTLAITKSEGATAKQIDQIGTLIAATSKATDEKIADLKGRLDRGEGASAGAKGTKDDNKAWIAIVVSFLAVLITAVIGVIHLIKP
jgi:hypothetical protein